MKANNMVKQIPMKHLAFFSLLCSSAASAAERPNIGGITIRKEN